MRKILFFGLCALIFNAFFINFEPCIQRGAGHGYPGPICSRSIASEEIPAPFAKAKEMILQTEPDSKGRYLLTFEIQKNGANIIYIIGYLSKEKIIGIGTLEPIYLIFEFNEESKEFSVYALAFGGRQSVQNEKVIEGAFKIFRELVANKLI